MKNITELRVAGIQLLADIRSGEIDTAKAAVMNNSIGKISQTIALELKYREVTKSTGPIPFLEYQGDSK